MTAIERLEGQRSLLNVRLGEINLKIAIERARVKRRMGTRKKELDRITQARDMRAKGCTHAQIASVMGYSRSRAQSVTKGVKCRKSS